MNHIVIIGNGIAGVTAARWIRKLSNNKITIISSESEFFFSRTALMYVYMGHMRWKDIEPYDPDFWVNNNIELIFKHIHTIHFNNKLVYTSDELTFKYDQLILATGSKSNFYNWPGQNLKGVSGLYSKQDLENIESISSNLTEATIVGGGLIGIELAEMLHSRNKKVSLLVREPLYWSNILPTEEAKMITHHIYQHGIDLHLETQLIEIKDNGEGKVSSVVCSNGLEIPCQFVGITTGVSPNIDFLRNTEISVDKGILVNEYLETSIPGVYAIGDCAQLKEFKIDRRAIEAVWYTARMMGETVAHTICGEKKIYNPGIWFNSAKFFDLEYQVYGLVPAKIEYPLDSYFWTNGKSNKSIRIVFDHDTKIVKGFNLIGIRFRQEVCHYWISNKSILDKVIADIRLAFFDPEFYTDYSKSILHKYRLQFGKTTKLRSKGTLNQVIHLLRKKIPL